LPDAEGFPELVSTDAVKVSDWGIPSAYARRLRCLDNDAWAYGYPRRWDPSILTSSMRTDHTEISRRRFRETPSGSIEPISRFYRLPANGVSNTLRAGTDSARGAFTSPRPIHYEKARCITVREMARLHGFPDWFRFHETKWHGARQIGNAVPPPLACAIAVCLVQSLRVAPTRPAQVLDFGDEELLRMDMSQAAKHWGVDTPISRRDRKSGARKRSQWETEATRLAELRTVR
jgi:DNA (cytosine-5)-methyltransferase 1